MSCLVALHDVHGRLRNDELLFHRQIHVRLEVVVAESSRDRQGAVDAIEQHSSARLLDPLSLFCQFGLVIHGAESDVRLGGEDAAGVA